MMMEMIMQVQVVPLAFMQVEVVVVPLAVSQGVILSTLPHRIHPMVVDLDLLLLKTKAKASLGHLYMPNIMMGSQSIEGMAMDSTLPLDMGYSTTNTLDHMTMSNKCQLMKHHLGLIQCHCLDLMGVKSVVHSDRGSRERRRHDGGGSTCDIDIQSQIQSDTYPIPMPQAVLYNELIQPHFAFQQIPPCIYEAPRQEINSDVDLIFDFNFDQYQALSQ